MVTPLTRKKISNLVLECKLSIKDVREALYLALDEFKHIPDYVINPYVVVEAIKFLLNIDDLCVAVAIYNNVEEVVNTITDVYVEREYGNV